MKQFKRRGIIVTALIIILEIVLLMYCTRMFAQDYKGSISGVYAPQDNGLGLRVGYSFDAIGIYSALSIGNYKGVEFYHRPFYIKDHIRISAGVLYFSGSAYLSAGLAVHSFGETGNTDFLNPRAFEPISAEFGVGCCINRFISGFRFDPFKWTGRVEVGIRIIKLKQ